MGRGGVYIPIRTEAELAGIQRMQKELDQSRSKLMSAGKSVEDFTKEMRKLDSQQRALNKLMPETHGSTSKLKDLFAGFTITAGDVWNGLKSVAGAVKDFAMKGAEAQKATDTLRFSVERAGYSWTLNAAALDANIQRVSWLAAVDDEDLAVAQSKLVRSTGELADSQKMLGLATDISAMTGKDLSAVTKALSQAYHGNYGALSKLGVAMDGVSNSTEAMNKLYAQFGGGAEYVNKNMLSSTDRMSIAFDNLKETAGQAFGPTLSKDMDSTALALQLVSNQTLTGGEKWKLYWKAFGGSKDNLKVLKDALGLNTDSMNKMSGATFRATQAQRELTEAQQQYSDLSVSAEQSSINLARAQNSLEDAQKRAADALKHSGSKSREYEDALLDVRQAELDLNAAKKKNADNKAELDAMQREIDRLKLVGQAAEAAKRGYRVASGRIGGRGGIMMAEGGILPATRGGINVTAAEDGDAEAFIPLRRTRRSQTLAAQVAEAVGLTINNPGTTSNVTNIHFHGQVASYSDTVRAVRDAERSLAW